MHCTSSGSLSIRGQRFTWSQLYLKSLCLSLLFLFSIPSPPYSGLIHSLAVLAVAQERKLTIK